MNMVTVMTFNERPDADAIQQRLTQAGVPNQVIDERRQQRYRFWAEEMAGIHIQVSRDNFERARDQLQQWHQSNPVGDKAVHCPQCGSSRVEFPQVTRKFLMPMSYAFLCAIGVCEKRFYCEDCHFTWPLRAKVETPTDILGWPIRSPKEKPAVEAGEQKPSAR